MMAMITMTAMMMLMTSKDDDDDKDGDYDNDGDDDDFFLPSTHTMINERCHGHRCGLTGDDYPF